MTSNKLKIIAIITMIIDHFAYYFSDILNTNVYIFLRIIGRVSMPIFVFLIIEGYFHTKNLKKYILRIGVIAIITQISFIIIENVFAEYSLGLSKILNILFSFINILLLIKLFENSIEKKNIISKMIWLLYIILMLALYTFLEYDYGFGLLILGFFMYLIKKYVKNIYVAKILLALLIIVFSFAEGGIYSFASLSVIIILLYNNNLGKKSKLLKYMFYIIFPLQHIVLYISSILYKIL
jgi:hypothetical protein